MREFLSNLPAPMRHECPISMSPFRATQSGGFPDVDSAVEPAAGLRIHLDIWTYKSKNQSESPPTTPVPASIFHECDPSQFFLPGKWFPFDERYLAQKKDGAWRSRLKTSWLQVSELNISLHHAKPMAQASHTKPRKEAENWPRKPPATNIQAPNCVAKMTEATITRKKSPPRISCQNLRVIILTPKNEMCITRFYTLLAGSRQLNLSNLIISYL